MLSNTSKYALRALIYLALKGDMISKIGIKQISKDLEIPMPAAPDKQPLEVELIGPEVP